MQEIDPNAAQEYLDQLDKKSGVNTGKAATKEKSKTKAKLSQPNELGLKNIPLENLPSKGKFYVGFRQLCRICRCEFPMFHIG